MRKKAKSKVTLTLNKPTYTGMCILNLSCWNKFEMKKIKDYHELYLKCDVSLLGDVFEKIRRNSLRIMDYVQVIIRAHQV